MRVLIAWFRLRYVIHRAFHAGCEKRAIQQYHAGYIKGAQDERSLMHNATLERQLRDAIKDAGW